MKVRASIMQFVCMAATVALIACDGGHTCAGVGAATYVTPMDTTISVGGTVTLRSVSRAEFCSGDGPLPPEKNRPSHWHLADTTIVRLDTLTGTVTGRAVGNVTIMDDFQQTGLVRVR